MIVWASINIISFVLNYISCQGGLNPSLITDLSQKTQLMKNEQWQPPCITVFINLLRQAETGACLWDVQPLPLETYKLRPPVANTYAAISAPALLAHQRRATVLPSWILVLGQRSDTKRFQTADKDFWTTRFGLNVSCYSHRAPEPWDRLGCMGFITVYGCRILVFIMYHIVSYRMYNVTVDLVSSHGPTPALTLEVPRASLPLSSVLSFLFLFTQQKLHFSLFACHKPPSPYILSFVLLFLCSWSRLDLRLNNTFFYLIKSVTCIIKHSFPDTRTIHPTPWVSKSYQDIL